METMVAVYAKIPRELRDQLQREAEAKDRSLSQLIRMKLEEAGNNRKGKKTT